MNNNIFEGYNINNRDASTIVDFQKTFSENRVDEQVGSLMVGNTMGLEVITNQAIDYFKNKGGMILASREMHGEGHISFASSFVGKKPITEVGPEDQGAFITYDEVKNWTHDNNGLTESAGFTVEELKTYLQIRGTEVMWPEHGQDYNWESEYVTGLDTNKIDEEFIKGDDIAEHTYTAFAGKNKDGVYLADFMRESGIERNFVYSLATDFCVKNTAIDSAKEGFDTYFIERLSRSVYPENDKQTFEEMQDNQVKIIRI